MTPYYEDAQVTLYQGDARDVLRELPDESVNCAVTSPPYWGLRDYGMPAQIGLEGSPSEYICSMVDVFREVRRVLRTDGTLWLNLGDSYATTRSGSMGNRSSLDAGRPGAEAYRAAQVAARPSSKTNSRSSYPDIGLKSKDLGMLPHRVAIALQQDGWWVRSDIVWHKTNPMPESVNDRPTKAHEYLFLLTKSERYYYNGKAIREPLMGEERDQAPDRAARVADGNKSVPTEKVNGIRPRGSGNLDRKYRGDQGGVAEDLQRAHMGTNVPWEDDGNGRNKRSVWSIPTAPFPEAHFATFPPALVEPCILAGAPPDGVVLDPFIGSGTTAMVARWLGRRAIGIDLNPEFLSMAEQRSRRSREGTGVDAVNPPDGQLPLLKEVF